MMSVTILAVGRLKEKYLTQAQEEYKKRLKSYVKIEIIEIADEGFRANITPALQKEIKQKEAQRLMKQLKQDTMPVSYTHLDVYKRQGLLKD